MIRRPPRSTLFPYDALPISRYVLDLHKRANVVVVEKLQLVFGLPRLRPHDHQWRLRRGSPKTDRKSTRLNSSHVEISYAVFCLKKKKNISDARKPETLTTTS